MTNSKGNMDCINGEAMRLALEIPSKEAIGLTQIAPQAPLLQTVKNKGIIELILPDKVVQMDLIFFILLMGYS